MRNTPPATRNLLIINCIVYFAVMLTAGREQGPFDMFMLYYPTSEYFHWWQYVTYMFMHGGFAHLFFNMYALWLFGSMVEQTLGTKRFLILYFVTGIGAALLHTGVEYYQYMKEFNLYVDRLSAVMPGLDTEAVTAFARAHFVSDYLQPWGVEAICPPTVGASGAIYGVMMAFAMLHPRAEMQLIIPPVRLTAKWMVIVFGGIELLTGIFATADGVAHFAHLGGMLFAFFLVLYWKKHLYDNYWN